MEKEQVLFQNVTPADFDHLQTDLMAFGYSVFQTSVDTFNALVMNVHAHYNRNQNTLLLSVDYHKDYKTSMEALKADLLKIGGKEDVSDKLQAKPVETPIDRKTGQPEPPPKPLTVEEQQAVNDADPLKPIEAELPPEPPPEKKEEHQSKKVEVQESSKKK